MATGVGPYSTQKKKISLECFSCSRTWVSLLVKGFRLGLLPICVQLDSSDVLWVPTMCQALLGSKRGL